MMTNSKHAKIVHAIIDMGHNLDLNVVAEGVSTREIKDELERLGCDAIQGSYLSVPIFPEEVPDWRKQYQVTSEYVGDDEYTESRKQRTIV